jgi:hypothetical protein
MLPFLFLLATVNTDMDYATVSRRPLVIPAAVRTSNAPSDVRLGQDEKTFTVPAGLQITARIHGDMPMPQTDPGRMQIRVELVLPLLAKDGKTILLPTGTQLVGQVHLLRGELRFINFQFILLPDGRSVGMSEDAFGLGPGPLLAIPDGSPAMVTVNRPLRVEAFGAAR